MGFPSAGHVAAQPVEAYRAFLAGGTLQERVRFPRARAVARALQVGSLQAGVARRAALAEVEVVGIPARADAGLVFPCAAVGAVGVPVNAGDIEKTKDPAVPVSSEMTPAS